MATKKPVLPSTQKYLNIIAIKDGMVILKDGGIRGILDVGSLNFALKSEEEQNGMIFQYQQFLNSLKFPLQIVMQSRRLDLYGYLKRVRELIEKQTNDLIRMQTEEYANYIEKLLARANIMDKKFYVVVPYFPGGMEKAGLIDKVLGSGSKTGEVHFTKEQFEEYRRKLDERINIVTGGLGGMGLKVSPLDSQKIIEMLYGIYNPTEAINERMTEVNNLESPIVQSDVVMPTDVPLTPEGQQVLASELLPVTSAVIPNTNSITEQSANIPPVTSLENTPQANTEAAVSPPADAAVQVAEASIPQSPVEAVASDQVTAGSAAQTYAIPQEIQSDTSITSMPAPEITNAPVQTEQTPGVEAIAEPVPFQPTDQTTTATPEEISALPSQDQATAGDNEQNKEN